MSDLVDVAVSIYGKPFQTAATLASLHAHSGQHIAAVYFQEEHTQPHTADVQAVIESFPDIHFIHYRPKQYLGWNSHDRGRLNETDYRQSIRYQYAWENSDRDFLFVTHNDCMYSGDIIGSMLKKLDDTGSIGAGLIGQCWNCPASMIGACNGDLFHLYKPTHAEVLDLLAQYPNVRLKAEMIDIEHPMPVPECRLNEFACLINLAACRAEVMPVGPIVPFGFMTLDIGVEWFRQLVLRGYTFVNWKADFIHAPFSAYKNGHLADLRKDEYDVSELAAHDYLWSHFPDVASRLRSRLTATA